MPGEGGREWQGYYRNTAEIGWGPRSGGSLGGGRKWSHSRCIAEGRGGAAEFLDDVDLGVKDRGDSRKALGLSAGATHLFLITIL